MKIKAVLFLSVFFLVACGKKEDVKPEEEQKDEEETVVLDHPFTLKEGEKGWKYEANGQVYEGTVRIISSTEMDKSFPIEFMGPPSQGYPNWGGFGFLPQQTGTFRSGYDFGAGNGTGGNNYYLTGSLIIAGETYYAYSSHAYGFLEEERIEGADCTVQITQYEGKYTRYRAFGYTLTGFVGTVEGRFAGTFKTKDGSKSIVVTKGEFREIAVLPAGAEILD